MRARDQRTLNLILNHREYFDQNILFMIDHLDTTVNNLTVENKSLRTTKHSLNAKISSLDIKRNDLLAQN